MRILGDLNPTRVFYYFEELCKIPHGSYNTKAISDYCVSVAKGLGLKVRQDEFNNVVIWKPASPGSEQAPVMMLQGHLDMVCEQEPGINHDFEHEGLELQIADGYVTANGTTLGGDDGIAIAISLAILEDKSLIHPPLEVVFTTEEEVGMEGALGLDTSDLTAKYLLNLDSEDEGVLTVSCAGGTTMEIHVPYDVDTDYDLQSSIEAGMIYELKITGLQGGHSGVEIHKGRASSNKLMAQLLQDICTLPDMNYRIVSIQGGLKHNAIPRETTAIISVQSDYEVKQVTGSIGRYQGLFQECYGDSDPAIRIEFQPYNGKGMKEEMRVMTKECSNRLIQILYLLPNGVQAMSQSIEGLPETSLNIGILKTGEQEIYIEISNRSSNSASLELLVDSLHKIAGMYNVTCVKQSEYPGWSYRRESKLRDTMVSVYETMFHKPVKIEAIHAGLECGILSSKMPELDIVSTGPDLLDIHTPQERLSIESVERTYAYVLAVLESFARQK